MADDPDTYVEVTTTSWLERIGQALIGMALGVIFLIASVAGLFWNEGRSVGTAKAIKEGLASVKSVAPDRIDPANDGKLVHVTGLAEVRQPVSDPVFAVTVKAIKLKRQAQMFQWKQSEKSVSKSNVGGSETTQTTYTYTKVWSESLIDSSQFKKPEGHANPGYMTHPTLVLTSPEVRLGAFTLSWGLLNALEDYEELPLAEPPKLPAKARLWDKGLYIGEDPGNPKIGDQKIVFSQIKPAVVSLYAAQSGSSFAPYPTASGKPLERIETGSVPPERMFAEAKSENTVLTWIVRACGTAGVMIGLMLLANPIAVVLDVLPVLGSLAGAGIFLMSVAIGLPLSLATIGVAWLFYRPVIGAVLLAASLALLLLLSKLGKAKPGKKSA